MTTIIVTHDGTDFDALASQVAAQRLYPGAEIVRCNRLEESVRRFLSLHKDRFPTTPLEEVDLAGVSRVVIVDVRRAGRLRELAPLLDRVAAGDPGLALHVFDHHDEAPDDLRGEVHQVELVGATVTLLIERIRAAGQAVDPMEATLMALGIHADTGSLTYPKTTARDARALAWLMSRGASLKMVRRYLRAPLTDEQRVVMGRLLAETEAIEVQGLLVGIACVPVGRSVGSLATVVRQVLDIEPYDALFALLHGRRRVQIIARSRVPHVDVGEVLQAMGGGGHVGAGAATVRDADVLAVRRLLVELLRAQKPAVRRVRHVMSTPARTLDADASLGDARALLAAWDVSGAPVLRAGVLVGVLSRHDLEAAELAGWMDRKVLSRTTQPARTASPDDRLEQALKRMVDADVGRLPVTEDGHVVGIVARSDLLRVLYPADGAGDGEDA